MTFTVLRPMVPVTAVTAFLLFLLLCVFPETGERLLGYSAREERIHAYVQQLEDDQGKIALQGVVTGRTLTDYGYSCRVRVFREAGGFSFSVVLPEMPRVGSLMTFRGKVKWPSAPMNPGQFDEITYARSQGIAFTLRSAKAELLKELPGPVFSFFLCSRDEAATQIRKLWDQPYSGILCAMLLGEKSFLPEEEKELFQQGGISHILAISGLHLSMVAEWIYTALEKMIHKKGARWGAAILLWLYAFWTGGSVSTLRAALMFTLKMMAPEAGRQYDFASAFCFAGLILLLLDPMRIRQAGFYMSFAALLGMQVGEALALRLTFLPYVIRKKIAASLGVTLFSLPLTLWFFYEASPASFLLNLWVIPSMSLLLPCAVLGTVLSALLPGGGDGFGEIVRWILQSYELGSKAIGSLQGIPLLDLRGKPSVFSMICLAAGILLLMLLLRKKNKILKGLVLLLFLVAAWPVDRCCISFLYVGQGDCTVIEWQGVTVVMDAGPSYDTVIRPFLMQEGIRSIDLLVLSHPDEDHMEGALLLAEDDAFRVKCLLISSDEAQDTLRRQELVELVLSQGGKVLYGEGGAERERTGLSEEDSLNDTSLVMQWELGGELILFPGDISAEAERALISSDVLTGSIRRGFSGSEISLEHRSLQTVDLLKTAHHGSASSTSEAFLEVIRPETAVISCGINNAYGHPAPVTLERLEEAGTHIYCTAESGMIRRTYSPFSGRWTLKEFLKQ
ncbi:MAG: DNA internalization-related competence protein ComEC/Rec2 [Lachnospiraceae bacterium]|nr:DNA internalization-related competence protein ComEC/Rec2 [Lachnospiraceae bacterium]